MKKLVSTLLLSAVGLLAQTANLGMQGYVANPTETPFNYRTMVVQVQGVAFFGGSIYADSVATGTSITLTVLSTDCPFPKCTLMVMPQGSNTILAGLMGVGQTMTIPTSVGQGIVFKFRDGRAPTFYQQMYSDLSPRYWVVPSYPLGYTIMQNWDGLRHGALLTY